MNMLEPRQGMRTNLLYDQLMTESARIVKQGGQPIPRDVIEKCLETRYNHRLLNWQDKVRELLKPCLLTIPAHWKEHTDQLRRKLLHSSRFTVLRQKIGLPFKSRRQPWN